MTMRLVKIATGDVELVAACGIAILSLYLRDKLGYSDNGATVIYHTFTMFVYFFPLIGAMVADGWLGKYRTIFYLSIVYALGNILISITAMPPLGIPALEFTMLALLLIAFGTGGIKPCVSAFGGDQFKLPEQAKFLGYFFSLFYFAINAGSLISTFLTPVLRADVQCFGESSCYSLAFGVPGILMFTSIVMFVLGKRRYIIKNPTGNIIAQVSSCIGHGIVQSFKSKDKREHWLDRADDKYDRTLIEDIKCLLRVLVLFVPLPVFWALFDQQGSRWTFQADRMRHEIGNWKLQADQMQVLNPLLILFFIPLCEVAVYPFLRWCKIIRKPLHKMVLGGFLAAAAFVISGVVELHLVPTYGTPLAAGLGQLRVYNGYNCRFDLTLTETGGNKSFSIEPLSAFESLEIPVKVSRDMAYYFVGQQGTECDKRIPSGRFHVVEQNHSSYFISKDGLTNFVDNNDKAINSVKVRFLSNLPNVASIQLRSGKKTAALLTDSANTEQNTIATGNYDIVVNGSIALQDYLFETGAVFTIMIYGNENGVYTANPVKITPENSVHILWLIPQYVVITFGEVMFSVTGLEFSFTQAPASMKSVLQSAWLLTVTFGNLIVILIVQGNILDAQWKEFFLFAGLMAIDMIIFGVMALRYKYVIPKDTSQDHNMEKISKD